MSKLLNVSSSSHVRSHKTTHSIIPDVAIAMLPATAFGVYHSGTHALLVPTVTVAACVLSEYVYEKLTKKSSTISDCSALVTGLILAPNMPPKIPAWIPALDGIFAIIVVRQPYGGLGQNLMNPALTARCFLLISLVGRMTNFSYSGFDDVSGTTLLVVLKGDGIVDVPAMFVGNTPGTIGEVSVVILLTGAAYLLARKVIPIRTPGIYIPTVVVFVVLFEGHGFNLNHITAYLCGGGLIFGALFMATDYVTSPIMPEGQIVFGILLGVFTGLSRIFGGSAEGVPYAVIISNILVPLIEKVTPPKAPGREGK